MITESLTSDGWALCICGSRNRQASPVKVGGRWNSLRLSRRPVSEPQCYLLLTEVSSEPICSYKLRREHRSGVPSDLRGEDRFLGLFCGLSFHPSGRKVGRNRGKEGKREGIPPPFSSGIPEERKKGKYS